MFKMYVHAVHTFLCTCGVQACVFVVCVHVALEAHNGRKKNTRMHTSYIGARAADRVARTVDRRQHGRERIIDFRLEQSSAGLLVRMKIRLVCVVNFHIKGKTYAHARANVRIGMPMKSKTKLTTRTSREKKSASMCACLSTLSHGSCVL